MDSNQKKCGQCQTPLIDDLPGGLCPGCLMSAAQKSQEAIDATQGRATRTDVPEISELEGLFPELEILDLIGHGGMGAVYRAKQKNLDRIVALKIFLYDTQDTEFAARFQREARALAKLNHPNIVTVHDFGQRSHLHYLIMEFVEGLNLRQITVSEKLDPVEALEMVPQLCDALQYAHDQGVIHRDIKPENLLLDVNGRIKIADFGLAKMTGTAYEGTLTRTRQVMGTLNYMAPEQRERPTDVDHRADIYSLGVVIYELLTGELPLGRFQPPSFNANVNKALDDVVMRALEKSPERRFQQAREFKTGFQSADHHYAETEPGGPGHAHFNQPVPPVKPPRRPSFFDNPDKRFSVALFGGCEKKGAWQPGRPHFSISVFGVTKLDLTQVQQPDVDLKLFTLFGGCNVVVAPGTMVDVDGIMAFGGIEDQAQPGASSSNMRVRVRAYGAFGGCKIATAPMPQMTQPVPPTKRPHPNSGGGMLGLLKSLLLMFYWIFSMLVTIACPIVLLASQFRIIGDEEGILAGAILGLIACVAWSSQKYVRRLIGAGPESNGPRVIAQYQQLTIIGTVVRLISRLVGMASGICFIVFAFEGGEEILFSAIVVGIVALGLLRLSQKLNREV